MKIWDETDVRNLFITNSNILKSQMDQINEKLKKITNGKIFLNNIGKAYQDKMFEIEREFKEHNQFFFEENVLKSCLINDYFSVKLSEYKNLLSELISKMKYLNVFYLGDRTSNLANKILKNNLEKLRNIEEELISFSIEKDIINVLKYTFTNSKEGTYMPGELLIKYQNIILQLTKLGYTDKLSEIEKEIKPLVQKQEEKNSEFLKSVKSENEYGNLDISKADEKQPQKDQEYISNNTKKMWTETDERNLFISQSNDLKEQMDKTINKIETVTGGKVSLKNLVNVYQEKMFEIENESKEHNKSFFGRNRLRSLVDYYLRLKLIEYVELVKSLSQELNYFYELSLSRKIDDERLQEYLDEFKKFEEELCSFSIEKDIVKVLRLEFTNDDKLIYYLPGDFLRVYQEVVSLLTELGYTNKLSEIEKEIKPLVQMQEEKCLEFKKSGTITDDFSNGLQSENEYGNLEINKVDEKQPEKDQENISNNANKMWTETDERNLFISRSNDFKERTAININKIKMVTDGKMSFNNIGKAYQEKMFEIENEFKEHNKSFFDRNYLRILIDGYLHLKLGEYGELLNSLSQELICSSELSLSGKIDDRRLQEYLDEFKKIEEELCSFNLEKDIVKVLRLEFTNDDKLIYYLPGNFLDEYQGVVSLLTELGHTEKLSEIEKEIKPLVQKQEEKCSEYWNSIKRKPITDDFLDDHSWEKQYEEADIEKVIKLIEEAENIDAYSTSNSKTR